MDPIYLALYRLRRRQFDPCVTICSDLLDRNPQDQAVWYIKAAALTKQAFIDDSDLEEEGVADVLLDTNAVTDCPRPGTSIQGTRPQTSSSSSVSQSTLSSVNQGVRPMTNSGRPLTGFARPSTGSQRSGTSSGSSSVQTALQNRPGTSRAMTASGRFARLGTASMVSGDPSRFIAVERLDLKKYAARPALAKVLCDYILYVDHNPRKALELAAHATVECDYNDWWWKSRLGKCYYQLGLYRDAEKQYLSANKSLDMIITYMELCKVALRLDQPNRALQVLTKGVELHAHDSHLLLGIARTYEMMNDVENSSLYYKKVLKLDSSNVEALASIAAHQFYEDQYEISLQLYKRLLLMGIQGPELWNNMGLSCFYSSQYDLALSCFERAIALSEGDAAGDVWYNIGQVAIGIGDLGLAYQAFKIAMAMNPRHSEACNNLAVLELRKGNFDAARQGFLQASKLSPHCHEPLFNGALLAFKAGDYETSYTLANRCLEVYPQHADSRELLRQLSVYFSMS